MSWTDQLTKGHHTRKHTSPDHPPQRADIHMHPTHIQPQACRYGALTGCMPENCLLVAMKVGQTIRPPTPLGPLSFQCLGPPVFLRFYRHWDAIQYMHTVFSFFSSHLLDVQVYEPECYDLVEEDMDELFGDTTEEEFSVESFIDDETFILEVTVGGRRCLNIHSAYPHIHPR